MAKTTTVTKQILTRDWNDLEPKLLVFLTTGVTASGLILIGNYLGLTITAPEASLGVVLISTIAGYIKKSSQTLPAPIVAPKVAAAASVTTLPKVSLPTTTAPASPLPSSVTNVVKDSGAPTLAQQVTELATPVPPVTS